jgi:uncharacterized MAPEG superfamily protein
MALFPRVRSIFIATKGEPLKWDNRNPRSTTLKADLQKKLDARTFRAYERAVAAHANCMENIPIFATAVILGNMAKLPREGMNTFVGAYLFVRAAHMHAYLVTDHVGLSFIRGPLFTVGMGLCVNVMIKAARELV